ncbi:MAG: hypothetical protein JJ992_20025, partial [Planctomycetes bacterium]|nr:hypothetical protein [Planctomycetota bacterium]
FNKLSKKCVDKPLSLCYVMGCTKENNMNNEARRRYCLSRISKVKEWKDVLADAVVKETFKAVQFERMGWVPVAAIGRRGFMLQ